MENRKYGQAQHQPLFKPMVSSATDKYPGQQKISLTSTGPITNVTSHPSHSVQYSMQYATHTHQINTADSVGSSHKGSKNGGGSAKHSRESTHVVAFNNGTAQKGYSGASGRSSLTRVPSQIINPAAMMMRESASNQRIDESYEAKTTKAGASKATNFKIEYQPSKNTAVTRKQSKVSTLVNSLMTNSANTTGIMTNLN